jgi:hypothetical protein
LWVSFLAVNEHACGGVVDGWFLALPVGLALDDELVGGGDEPVDGGLGYLTSDFRVSMTSMTGRRAFAADCRGRLIFLCP